MTNTLLKWDIYTITSTSSPLTGVKLRGRLRKFAIRHNINLLAENTTDPLGNVRIAILEDTNIKPIETFLQSIIPDAKVTVTLKSTPNPVLSKLKINDLSRYQI